MKKSGNGYMVLFCGVSGLIVVGVVASQDEAECLAREQVEQFQGHGKAYVLQVTAAFE